MRRMTLGRAGALAAITAALCLAQGGALAAEASAQTYYLDSGSVTVEARDGKRYVTQVNGVTDEPQTTDTVISQTVSSTATSNTIAVVSGSGQTAKVTLSGVNVDVSGADRAAMSTSGEGDVTVTLTGQNVLKSGTGHAGLEKNSTGNLTITAGDTGQSLYAEGGGHDFGSAGIGGGEAAAGTDITISGGKVTATGGDGAVGGAGIGGGGAGSGSDITVTGGEVTATGGEGTFGGAGIGGGGVVDATGSSITVTGGKVTATGGKGGDCGGAGIGGGGEGSGSDITVTGGEVTATGGGGIDGGAGIGGGGNGDGRGITVTGGEVTAAGGDGSRPGDGGAGIGGGGAGTAAEVKVWDTAHLKAQGGDTSAKPVGSDPDTSELTSGGWIKCYAAGADMSTAVPTSTTVGTHSHSWSEWTVVQATCTADGSRTRTCTVNNSFTEAETIPATGHKFTAKNHEDKFLKSGATCTESAIYYKSCSVCGLSSKDTDDEATFNYGEPLDHDWGEATYTWSKDHSSCTARRACRNDAGHVEEGTATVTAKVTQEKSCTDDELTTYTAAFENTAFATQTAEDVKTADATGHVPETVPAVAATCTEDGLTEGSRCSVCGTVLTEQKPVPAAGHDFTAEKVEEKYLKSAATCTKSAAYYRSCASCGESSKGTDDEATFENGEPDATAHGHLTHVAAKAATAKAEGNTEYWYCTECERYFSNAAGTKEIELADTVVAKKAEPAKKAKKKSLPTTGDASAAQAAVLLAGSLAALGAALAARRRAA